MPDFIIECAKLLGLVLVVVGGCVAIVNSAFWTIQTGCRVIKWTLWTLFSLLRASPRGVARTATFAGGMSFGLLEVAKRVLRKR